MTMIDMGNDVNVNVTDADETIDSPDEMAYAAPAEFATDEAEMVDDGGPGEQSAAVSRTLDGTGLELAARRVLAKRGIETADLEQGLTMESVRGPGRLRDILEATMPAEPALALPESIIFDEDGDGRERVFDTNQFPYSAIAALEITTRDGKLYSGTAWFVSPRTLITAGHCVFVRNARVASTNGWVRSIRVIPGRNGTAPGSEPFGSVTSTKFRSVAGWVNEGKPESDYAAILLPENAVPNGTQVGVLGTAVFNDATLTALNLNVAGYPGDKEGTEAQTLWFDVKRTKFVKPRQVFYDVDTIGGQSGAPVFVVQDGKRRVVAVHAYGTSGQITSNSGTRITAEVFKRIQEWKT
jgi:glutamyl endopeptidase